jgi:hypothetical protein
MERAREGTSRCGELEASVQRGEQSRGRPPGTELSVSQSGPLESARTGRKCRISGISSARPASAAVRAISQQESKAV